SVRTRSQPRRKLGALSPRPRGEESVPRPVCALNGGIVPRRTARLGKRPPRNLLKTPFTIRDGWGGECSLPHCPSTINQLGNGTIAEVSGWGIDGAPTGIRTALALSLGLRPFAFAGRAMDRLESQCCTAI